MMLNVPRLCMAMLAMIVLCGFETPREAGASEAAAAAVVASELAAAELGSPEAQAAMMLAEPIAEEARALTHLSDAAHEAIDPVVFTGRTLLLVPQFARPARVPFTLLKTPFQITHPVKAIDDLATIPGDLWGPFEATGKILCDTPRLLGPIRAVGSMGEFIASAARGARALPSHSN
jgi:hypothetical protein